MELDQNNLRELDSVKQFVLAAEQYCNLLEHHADFVPYDFMRKVAVCLTRLYGAAVELPEVECEWYGDRKTFVDVSITRNDYILDQFDAYRLIFNPYENDNHVTGSVTLDLTDIYTDIMAGLEKFQAGTSESICQAVYFWQINYEIHWGYHAVHALGAIHWLINSDTPEFRPSPPDYEDE